ncbi:MAG TPA: hypothetical protein PLY94_07770 [Gemmatimonadaceae bacterium]|nr:hypothetical protein [Gemmatimonadaceae bacterium]
MPRLHIPGSVSVTGIDFTKYTTLGFMFTPERYAGDYESIGLITVTIIPTATGSLRIQARSGATERTVDWTVSPVEAKDVLDEAHSRAVAMGADAIMNLSLQAIPQVHPELTFYGIELRGFAIKRK